MNEAVTITPFYYFMMEFARLVYAAFPLIVVIAGCSLIVGCVRTEPWGNSVDGRVFFLGAGLVIVGILLMVIL